jgi:hypothetical protein
MYADSAHLTMNVFVRTQSEGTLLQFFDDRLGILGLANLYYGFFFYVIYRTK